MNETSDFQLFCIGETNYETTFTKKFTNRRPYIAPDPKKICCVIPGVIQKVHVRAGQHVKSDEPLLILEAMKMQNDVLSPCDTRIKAVHVQAGQMVSKGELLIELE